jgi:hypothetical protein
MTPTRVSILDRKSRLLPSFCSFALALLSSLSCSVGQATTILTNVDLPFGDINVLVLTDVHSWVGGHSSNAQSVDYGDVLSFFQRLKAHCQTHQMDLWLVDNGDWIDGTGISLNGDISYLTPVLERMPWDAINVGNHELYRSSVITEFLRPGGFVEWWGDRYLSSNVIHTERQQPLGQRYRFLRGRNATVLTFGFLYNMDDASSLVTVETVETVVEAQWFVDVVTNVNRDPQGDYDAILVLAHMDADDSLVTVLLNKIRWLVGETMPVQFLTGHTHERKVQVMDHASVSFEAGKFLDTIGFVSFPRKQTLLKVADNRLLGQGEEKDAATPLLGSRGTELHHHVSYMQAINNKQDDGFHSVTDNVAGRFANGTHRKIPNAADSIASPTTRPADPTLAPTVATETITSRRRALSDANDTASAEAPSSQQLLGANDTVATQAPSPTVTTDNITLPSELLPDANDTLSAQAPSSQPLSEANDTVVTRTPSSMAVTMPPTRPLKANFFHHAFIDANVASLEDILGVTDLSTEDGSRLSEFILRTRKELGLLEVVGCSPRGYFLNRSVTEEDSLWRLFLKTVAPYQLLKPTSASGTQRMFLGGMYTFRFDVFKQAMVLDDVIAVAPFNDTIVSLGPSISGSAVIQVIRELNREPYVFAPNLQNFYSSPLLEELMDDAKYEILAPSFGVPIIMAGLVKIGYNGTVVQENSNFTDTALWLQYVKDNWVCRSSVLKIKESAATMRVPAATVPITVITGSKRTLVPLSGTIQRPTRKINSD